MQPLKLAIVGCGAIVENNHLPALADCPEWRLEWLVDTNQERVTRLARHYGCSGVTDIATLPDGLDAVLIATPNQLHGSAVRHFLQKNCHVLCEKPLTISSAEGEELLSLGKARQRLLVVGHQLRFLPSVQRLRDLLQNGQVGTIRSFDLAMGWASEWQSVTNFYQDHAMAGGGVMMDLGCHLLDLAQFLFGEVSAAKCLETAFSDGSRSLEKAICVEVTFAAGFTGLLRVSRMSNLINAIRVDGEFCHATASLEGGTLHVMAPTWALCAGGQAASLELPPDDPSIALWRMFQRAIHEGAEKVPDLCYGDSGVKTIRIIEQLYEENRSNGT